MVDVCILVKRRRVQLRVKKPEGEEKKEGEEAKKPEDAAAAPKAE